MSRGLLALSLTLAAATACSRDAAREYQLQGQVLAVDAARQEVTIAHGDIPGFMPGMTMTFRVADPALLAGRVPGDLVTATLVVRGSDPHLRTLERTGHAPVPPSAKLPAPAVLPEGALVADARLVDDAGRPRQLADWKGRTVAVTFTYTRCPLPNFCPAIDRLFQTVQEQLRADPSLKGHVQLLSVSFDPDHDTPEVLARHAAGLRADPSVWRFLTGSREEVETFAAQFGVSVIREGEPSEIIHNLRTAVIDPDGRLVTVLNGGDWKPEDLISALRGARDR